MSKLRDCGTMGGLTTFLKSNAEHSGIAMIRTIASFVILCLFCADLASTCAGNDGPSRTNVIYILADDLGYTDLACFGSRYYETPHLDQMARDGIRMTDAYPCGPNCQPTRAALMS